MASGPPERRSSPSLIRYRVALFHRAADARAEEPYRAELRLLAIECEQLAAQRAPIFADALESRIRIASERDPSARAGC
jgi:hypothetical protein